MTTPSLLLVDLTLYASQVELFEQLKPYWDVRRATPEGAVANVSRARPSVVCFEYDYPDAAGLRVLQYTKQTHPSVPVIMLTEQHSEALATWAFRSRVWDFLVKPILLEEMLRTLNSVWDALSSRRNNAGSRSMSRREVIMPGEARVCVPSPERRMLAAAVAYVASNFRGKIREVDAANLCRMSPFRFSRAFKRAYGITFSEYLSRFRLKEALRLMEHPGATITEVAYAVGFNDTSYFTKVFKRLLGQSPSEFRTGRMREKLQQASDPLPVAADPEPEPDSFLPVGAELTFD